MASENENIEGNVSEISITVETDKEQQTSDSADKVIPERKRQHPIGTVSQKKKNRGKF